MRGVGALLDGHFARADFHRRRRRLAIDLLSPFVCVRFADQFLCGYGGLIWIAKVLASISVGELHALDQVVQVVCRVMPHGFQRVGCQQIEHLDQVNTSR